MFTLVKINKVHRKQQGQEAKTKKKSVGMIITTWIELKSVHRLVSDLDHLNHCPIRHKNEVMQMNQTRKMSLKNTAPKGNSPQKVSCNPGFTLLEAWDLGF